MACKVYRDIKLRQGFSSSASYDGKSSPHRGLSRPVQVTIQRTFDHGEADSYEPPISPSKTDDPDFRYGSDVKIPASKKNSPAAFEMVMIPGPDSSTVEEMQAHAL